jgi:uncharacterized membrane protein (DUF373 family)
MLRYWIRTKIFENWEVLDSKPLISTFFFLWCFCHLFEPFNIYVKMSSIIHRLFSMGHDIIHILKKIWSFFLTQ